MGHELVSRPTQLKKIVAGAVAAVAVGSVPVANAGIELGEGLSVTGFIDQSFLYSKTDGSTASKTFGIDQVETDFLYSGSNGVSAEVDIEYGENASDLSPGDDTFVEQAFVTKKFTDEFSVKVGRFLSYSGWETEEPTGLFQYSASGYAPLFYGYYQQGISAAFSSSKFAVMGSVVNDVFGYANNAIERDTKKLGVELGVAVMPVEGLTAKAFYMTDDKTDRDVINVWASYAMSGFTFAGEYNKGEYGDGDADGYLAMANYATGPFGITLRYTHVKLDDYPTLDDVGDPIAVSGKSSSITLSPSYKVGDNLLLVAEFRKDNLPGPTDSKSFALEALFTF
jgi:hypothetical protein